MHILRTRGAQQQNHADPMLKIALPLCCTSPLRTGAPCPWCCALDCCSEQWLHACLNLLHWKLRELDPEGLATVAISLVKQGVVISNGTALPGGWLAELIHSASVAARCFPPFRGAGFSAAAACPALDCAGRSV